MCAFGLLLLCRGNGITGHLLTNFAADLMRWFFVGHVSLTLPLSLFCCVLLYIHPSAKHAPLPLPRCKQNVEHSFFLSPLNYHRRCGASLACHFFFLLLAPLTGYFFTFTDPPQRNRMNEIAGPIDEKCNGMGMLDQSGDGGNGRRWDGLVVHGHLRRVLGGLLQVRNTGGHHPRAVPAQYRHSHQGKREAMTTVVHRAGGEGAGGGRGALRVRPVVVE